MTAIMRPSALLAALAWSALALTAQAAPNDTLGYDDARHLLTRTGFGATDAEIRAFAPLTRTQAVDRLLAGTRTVAETAPPASALDPSPLRPPRGESSDAERKAFQQQQLKEGLELRGWWLQEMLVTPSPLTERMTLFWHNHFVSSQQKVRIARLMYRQNALLREYALGDFAALTHAVAKDPAMVIYLDSVQNRKGTPNENFAREVMELFTLGEGHYGEQDVKEAARAFTGWSVDRERGAFVFRRALHDDGVKTVLGRTGRFDGDDVLDILLARPETATFLTAKLWREFVSPDPDPREVERIAARFRATGYSIRAALRELLLSEAFYARENRATLVKSPIELTVGTLHTLQLTPAQPLPFAIAATGMGQNLYSPPNVKGWPGGDAWINTNSLLARKQFLERLARSDDAPATMQPVAMRERDLAAGRVPKQAVQPQGVAVDSDQQRAQRFAQAMDRGIRNLHFDAAAWVAGLPGATSAAKSAAAQRVLLPLPPVNPAPDDADAQALVRAALLDPVYQLK
jgi:uncharacterized protein (DUF1800 family)